MRTGLQTFARLVVRFCNFFSKYELPLKAAINSLSISNSDKAALLAAIDAIEGGCSIARAILIRVER